MELRQLKYFMELAETLNYSRAAERLFISQPTLSQQIAALERELGAQLFYRTRRKVELSPSGQVLLEYCLRVFSLLDEAQDKIRLRSVGDGEESTFVIGVDESVPHLDKQGFFSALDLFQANNPKCKYQLRILPYKAILPALQTQAVNVCISIVMQDELAELPCKSQIFGRQSIVLCVPKLFA